MPDDAPEYAWPPRTAVEVEEMVADAFARADAVHEGMPPVVDPPQEARNEDADYVHINLEDMDTLIQESTQPLYEGCPVNRLQASIVIMNIANLYGVSNTFTDELLRFLAGDLLPQSNCLPRSTYEMKRMVMRMGLEHEAIQCCRKGCILYDGEDNENLRECPHCQAPRYIEGSNEVPVKVLRYFPIIPRLSRLYRCPEVAKLLKWHADNRSVDGKMRSVCDSRQWAAVDGIDPTFKEKDTNLYMGLVTDGINPFGNQSSKHSMWPVLLLMYNLPPWLVSKKFFISLTLLIPGAKAPTSDNIDVYLGPLIKDLQKLWEGCPALDSSMPEGSRNFVLRAILLWTINDFPAYGLVAGQQVKGYKGCPVCITNTCAVHCRACKKMVYLGMRRWLPADHRLRRARVAFDGRVEEGETPRRPSGAEVKAMGQERDEYVSAGGPRDGPRDPVRVHGVKRTPCLFDLPYWSVSVLPLSFSEMMISQSRRQLFSFQSSR